MTTQQHIHIIGAGLGGLSLGSALSTHGLHNTLYDKHDGSPRHNYGITLHESTYQSLTAKLNLQPEPFRRQFAVDSAEAGTGVLGKTELLGSFRANRSRLETRLAVGLDIKWSAAAKTAEQTDDGITVQFEDGHEMREGIVVIADGVHSAVRKALLPEVAPKVLPLIAFNGKRRIGKAHFDNSMGDHMKESTAVKQNTVKAKSTVMELKRDDTLLTVSIDNIGGDAGEEQVSLSWIYSRAARGSDDQLYKPNRPNAGARDIPDAFYDEVAQLGDLPEPFKTVFHRNALPVLRNDRTLHWLMRTTTPPEDELLRLAERNVFFIGDAVHAQPILGGYGANEAIVDGLELADALANGGVDEARKWYKERIPVWHNGVEESERRISSMHNTSKSAL